MTTDLTPADRVHSQIVRWLREHGHVLPSTSVLAWDLTHRLAENGLIAVLPPATDGQDRMAELGHDDTERGRWCLELDAANTSLPACTLVNNHRGDHESRTPQGDLIHRWPRARRCCVGPFADGAHAANCIQRCQDCGGDPDGPYRCRCREITETEGATA